MPGHTGVSYVRHSTSLHPSSHHNSAFAGDGEEVIVGRAVAKVMEGYSLALRKTKSQAGLTVRQYSSNIPFAWSLMVVPPDMTLAWRIQTSAPSMGMGYGSSRRM